MVAVDDVLTDNLAACVRGWFEQDFAHIFFGVPTVSVPESEKPIPKKWVEDIELGIDEGIAGEEADVLGEGPTLSWSFEEGRQRLHESLARLDLPEDALAHRELHASSRHDLASEKRRVKQELKRYDTEFKRQFRRLPMHNEKEPMRPLYTYYRRLKAALAHVEAARSGGAVPSRRSSAETGGGNSDDDTPGGLTLGPRDGGSPVGGGGGGGSAREQISMLEARIESLQGEKANVRTRLQAFQERFVVENNRRIRFHRDILPIEREYRMYKQLKEEIMRAEGQLRDLKRQN